MVNKNNSNNHSKKAIIIGAGIIGLTTACRLSEEGYAITIFEQKSKPAEGTSKANAGQLIYNFGAMGSIGFLRNLPNVIVNPDLYGVIITGLLHPKTWPWALSFVGQCTTKAWRKNSLNLIKMAHRSRESLDKFCKRHTIDFNWRTDGKIITHETEDDVKSAELLSEFQRENGGTHKVISKEECFEREPALIGTTRKITGGTYISDAAVGDCYLFCQNLAQLLETKFKGRINYNVTAEKMLFDKNKVRGIQTNQGIFEADIFIICAGLTSNTLLPTNFLGKKPIMGVKGISLSYPIGSSPPNLSVTDAAGKFVVARLGQRIRVTGYAIFSENLNIDQQHVKLLAAKAESLMPKAALFDKEPDVWTGLRPQTPDDLPMIGKAGAENLFVNAGHGSNGWILAFGAAEHLLEKINE
jgi:D-amino-acid dehydrogenase